MMTMRTDSNSDTWGGRFAATFDLAGASLTAGLDQRTNSRDAVSKASMMGIEPPTTITNYTWPDLKIADTGLFAQADIAIAPMTNLTAGLRLDLVEASAGKADLRPQGMGAVTANELYESYYGDADTDQKEANVSGVLRVLHTMGPVEAWAGVSQATRTADATERGIVRSGGANSWVGNPEIDPEIHRQIDLGASYRAQTWWLSAGGWYDNVADFITRDTARGQPGVLQSNGASIYRNVRAELAGVDLSGEWLVLPQWRLGADAAYTYGQNLTDSRPLYNIAPLNGQVELAYEQPLWGGGVRFRWAADQTRADTDPATGSGLDVEKTPGYGVVDLFANWQPVAGLELVGGVSNLFDKTYASYLSQSNGFDPGVVKVNEPGRAVYVQASLKF